MKIIDSNDPVQMETERKGITWKDFFERKYEILSSILFCYFIVHVKEIRTFFFSEFNELKESWPIALGLLCLICFAVYLLIKTIQFLRFVVRFFILLSEALKKYVSG